MIIGVDTGYYATKTSEGIIFPSKITTQENVIDKNNEIYINDVRYIVGEGEMEFELNKIDKEITKVCLMYALAVSSGENDFNLVVGLPIGQYTKQKNQLKEMLMNNRITKVMINSKPRMIVIDNVEVFPQCAGALIAYNIVDDAILIDIGGRTIDICWYEFANGKRTLQRHSTIYEGTLSLYSKVIYEINNKYDTNLKTEDGEKILKNGLYIHGQKQDMSYLREIIAGHVNVIIQELALNYPIKTTKAMLLGGGAISLYNGFKQRLPNCSLCDNPQFTNALAFKKVGESLWGRY